MNDYSSLLRLATVVTLAFALTSCSPEQAPLLEGTGDHEFPITTKSDLAQEYFNQGLIFAYAFNHTEAERAFRESVRLDPDCAICYWGIALVLGPNYNMAMPESNAEPAWEAASKAVNIGHFANEKEQHMINALLARYKPVEQAGERAQMDQAYAEAMAKLADNYPGDADILTLYAESMMNLSPWQLYDHQGQPHERTRTIRAVLEKAIEINPRHPGALHYYIHVMEPSTEPERALSAARTLGGLVPVSGHLVHMPSHIYLRTGRYHEAVIANQAASEADENYVSQCNVQGFSADPYYPHNLHFLWYAAMTGGERGLALETAEKMSRTSDRPLYATLPLLTHLRFGQWQQVLDTAAKVEKGLFAGFRSRLNDANRADFHFARAVAHSRLGHASLAEQEMAALDAAITTGSEPSLVQQMYQHVGNAVLAEAAQDTETAISELTRAVEKQDQLPYREPPSFFYPVRQSLGRVLLEQELFAEAEQVFQRDLQLNPRNAWSSWGLRSAVRAQDRAMQAGFLSLQFNKSWEHADFELTTPSFL